MEKIKPEDVDYRIYSEDEQLWRDVIADAEKALKRFANERQITEALLEVAKDRLEDAEFQAKAVENAKEKHNN